MIVLAKLIKRATDDGLMEINDDVPLGKVYRVDMASKQTFTLHNVVHDLTHRKEIIREYPSVAYLPVELLEIMGAP